MSLATESSVVPTWNGTGLPDGGLSIVAQALDLFLGLTRTCRLLRKRYQDRARRDEVQSTAIAFTRAPVASSLSSYARGGLT